MAKRRRSVLTRRSCGTRRGKSHGAQNPAAAQTLSRRRKTRSRRRTLKRRIRSRRRLPVPPGVQAPNNPKAMPVPMLPTPPPRVRGVIPRNPAGAQPRNRSFSRNNSSSSHSLSRSPTHSGKRLSESGESRRIATIRRRWQPVPRGASYLPQSSSAVSGILSGPAEKRS